MVLNTETIEGERLIYKDELTAYLAANNVTVGEVVDWFKAQHPTITQGEIHQAFIDNGITLDEPPKNPQAK